MTEAWKNLTTKEQLQNALDLGHTKTEKKTLRA